MEIVLIMPAGTEHFHVVAARRILAQRTRRDRRAIGIRDDNSGPGFAHCNRLCGNRLVGWELDERIVFSHVDAVQTDVEEARERGFDVPGPSSAFDLRNTKRGIRIELLFTMKFREHYIFDGQTGLATVADAPARLFAQIRSLHKLERRLEEYRVRILQRRHIQGQQMQFEVATGRCVDQRHFRVVRTIAEAVALEQHCGLGKMTFTHFQPRLDVAEAVRTAGVVVDLGQTFAASGADAFDDDANAFVALTLEAVGASI